MSAYPARQTLLCPVTGFLRIVSWCIVGLGLIHISFAFPVRELSTDLLWFIGAGLALSFAGVINLLALKVSSVPAFVAALVCDALLAFLFLLSLIVLREPQVFIGAALFLFVTIGFMVLAVRSYRATQG
ncbi:MAG: hypothetical protein EOP84_33325 [Verrucomicrobiaceae bacterium]|nr:MAG: hypothetical protein EOP84_33325 [Verrucomicrobiaceae bacterium]